MAGSVARQGIDRVLSHSPKAHQSLPGPAPELCSGDHQKGCDLEGVEEAAPLRHTQLTHFKTMTTFNTQDQIIELTDDQLEAAQGGVIAGAAVDVGIGFIPILGQINAIAKLWGGSVGDQTNRFIDNLS